MTSEPVERRLAAVLSADAVGYSRLMNEDDEATVRTLQTYHGRIARLIDTLRGRVVDAHGDNLLAEFPSALGAVRCAIEIQRALAAENEKLAAARRMSFRIGIHMGDVMVEGSRIYGDGVNVAARLEGLAAPGGVCVSDLVYQQVRRRLDLAVTDLGERELKNIEGAVRAYGIGLEPLGNAGTPARAAAPVALAPPARPSLAVLPFLNMSGDPAQEYFSDGLTHDILEALVKIPGLFLISHGSMTTYKATGARPREVARELGVRHVLEGGVRKSEKRVRVTAHLVEAETGRHVWGDRYDRDVGDVFAVQDEIADHVVSALDVTLVGGENARVVRKHLRNPAALEIYYRAMDLMERFNKEDMVAARQLFREVIRLEPESPIGYADVAWTHYFEVERGWAESPAESLDRMADLARRALELGELNGYSYFMLAHMHLLKREHEEALRLADQALGERPSCQAAFNLKANILNYCERPEEAIPLARQAIRLSPVAPPWYPEVLATSQFLCGRHEEAITAANQALALAPDSLHARLVLAASLVGTGRLDAAKETGREILSMDPAFTLKRFALSQPYRDPVPLERLVFLLRRAGLREGDAPAPAALSVLPPRDASRRRVAPRPHR
jgi:adenylate cyclase